jgi:hypothetical protein
MKKFNLLFISFILIITGCKHSTDPSPYVNPNPEDKTLRGWQIDSTNTGLAGAGINRSSLELYTGPYNPPAGTIIREKLIKTGLDLSNGNITIERCAIFPSSIGKGMPIIGDNNTTSLVTIRDCDIDATAIDDVSLLNFAFSGCGIVERCNIFGMGCGIWLKGDAGPRAEGNYIHNLRATTGFHVDGLTFRDNKGPMAEILNNHIETYTGYETGTILINDESYVDNLLVEGNLLEGYGSNLILASNSKRPHGTNLRAINNRFTPTGYGTGYVDGGWRWLEWTDNYINDPSKPDNKGAQVPEPK